MKNPKLILGGLAVILFVIVAIIVLVPSIAKAQGLVDYPNICLNDLGAPPESDLVSVDFGVDPWPDNWGVFVSCEPKFKKNISFEKLKICAFAYEDVNLSGHLDFGDTEELEICASIEQ